MFLMVTKRSFLRASSEVKAPLGKHQKSLEYNQKALVIREEVLPPERPYLAGSYNNLALTYHVRF